ncbi:MAG TPA: FtsH protease activity modulator HflK [Buchnera sp. (in: enterobacteria)]|nr:FtsH protease activity modulator HflK [Buchnera sp. (in: enterobacteria)]
MAWNEPNNDKSNRDPWSKQDNKSKHFFKKDKKRKIFFFNLKYFFSFFRPIIKNYSKNFGSSRNIKTPIIIVFCLFSLFLFFSGFYIVKEENQGVVIRLGKFSHVVGSGLHWRPIFINKIKHINVKTIREITLSNLLLSAESKLLNVEINLQYRITNPKDYLFSVVDPDDSLRQIINGTLHDVIGRCSINKILKKDNTIIKTMIQKEIEEKISIYKLGITISDMNLKRVCLPKEVQHSFNKIRLANENKKKYIYLAKQYASEVIFLANSRAKHILEHAKTYKIYKVSEAKGNIIRFSKILHKYQMEKKITVEQIYVELIENILRHTKKILFDDNSNTVLFVSLNGILSNNHKFNFYSHYSDSNNIKLYSFFSVMNNNVNYSSIKF